MTASRFTLVLAGVGVAIAWLPFVAPVALSLAATVLSGRLLFDWLMPAELSPAFIVGAALLVWAAHRAGRGARGLVVVAMAAAAALVASQAAAVATGLASGATPARGWPLVLVMTPFLLYLAGALTVAVLGTGLVRDLVGRRRAA